MKESKLQGKKWLGITEDMSHRPVDVYSDEETLYAVYFAGTEKEYIAEANIADIKKKPSGYIFTPFAEFIDLF